MNRAKELVTRVFFIAFVIVTVAVVAPPRDSFESRVVKIEEGMTMSDSALLLSEQNIVYSDTLVRIISLLRRGDRLVQAGDYFFGEPTSAWDAVVRLAYGEFNLDTVRVRLQEGATREQMAETLAEILPHFVVEEFLAVTVDREGYLFPDTYFFFITATAGDVANRLEDAFNERAIEFEQDIVDLGHSLSEIITMASIIEREAYEPEDQKLISGVLWNRIELGIALQADATLYYLLGKPSSELTREDLATDSLYNTYKYKGLPPGPIGNPGAAAIDAALNPTDSDYLFYLSDEDGVTHYAEDFEGHKLNKARFLR